jgi:hypothetical protein
MARRYFVAIVDPVAPHTDAKGFGLVFPGVPGAHAAAGRLVDTVKEGASVLRNLSDLDVDIEPAALDKAGLASLDDVEWSEYLHGAVVVLVPYDSGDR